MSAQNGLACYLYCLAPCGIEIQCTAQGVDERHPVQLEPCGMASAAYSEVDVAEFCGAEGEQHLQDLGWIGPRVLLHEAAIEEIMRQSPVLPVRFGTLFTSLDSLRQSITGHDGEIDEFFKQIGPRQEWAVKGQLNRAEALRALYTAGRASEEARTKTIAPGMRYFQEKRLQAKADQDLSVRLKEFFRRVAAELGASPGAFRRRGVPAAEAGADTEVVLNWAFLLAPEHIEPFRASLERLNQEGAFPGLELVLIGPFPPYSFAPVLSSSTKQ